MLPDCVAAVMSQLEILSLEIQRMPKDPKSKFGNTWSYPYYSVCTTSTHDMGGIRQWWEEDRGKTQDFFNTYSASRVSPPIMPNHGYATRLSPTISPHPRCYAYCRCRIGCRSTAISGVTTRRTNKSNVPANSRHYWRYRMHLTLEDLIGKAGFNQRIRDKVRASGR